MKKLDLKQQLTPFYSASARKVEVIDVPRFNFLMIDGAIEPGQAPGSSPLFQENVQALYGAAYTLKFTAKLRKKDPVDYPVMPFEGLWSVSDGKFDINVKDNLIYTLLLIQPDLLTPAMFSEALTQLREKKGDQPAFARLRLEPFKEGLCVQTLHIGPYASEPATVEKMEAFARENGYTPGHPHHEIYLGNPLRADPAKLKTILRHPVKKA